jgi:hypothetical protein
VSALPENSADTRGDKAANVSNEKWQRNVWAGELQLSRPRNLSLVPLPNSLFQRFAITILQQTRRIGVSVQPEEGQIPVKMDMFVDKFVSLSPIVQVNFAIEVRVRETVAGFRTLCLEGRVSESGCCGKSYGHA